MKSELCKRIFIVFAIEHYNPLGIIRSLGEKGLNPIYIAIKGKNEISSMSKYIKKLHRVNTVEEGYQVLLSYGEEHNSNKPFIFTADDKTQSYLDYHYDELKDKFILFNAGEQGKVNKYMDKMLILDAAKRHGLNILPTRVLNNGEVPKDLEYPVITKSISPVVGGWKSDVHICKDPIELFESYESIKSPKVLVQKYIDKKNEYCLDGFSVNKGEDLYVTIESTYNYIIPGYYSPYMTVKNFDNIEMFEKLKNLFKEIGFEGIFSIEFLIDKDDNYYFSEINFRNSTWSYASTKNSMNLPYLWVCTTLHKGLHPLEYPIKENYTAMVEYVDYQKRVKEGNTSFFKWILDYLKTDCKFYFDWKDLKPSLYSLIHNKNLR